MTPAEAIAQAKQIRVGASDLTLDGLAAVLDKSISRKPLRERIAVLEARGELKYCGIYRNGERYRAGNFVTHDGGLWCCQAEATGTRPGHGNACWQLAVKSGGR